MLRQGRFFLCVLALLSAGVGWTTAAHAASSTTLVGTFEITPGSCAGAVVSGSYIRMVLPSGNPSSGPYFSNNYSTCSNQTYTLLQPGTDGGLITGSYQSAPSPAFDKSGNARAGRITAPQNFEGTSFATATSAVDPQTNVRVNAAEVVATGDTLSGDLRSFGVFWNNQVFNQGSPKPDGTYPGNTTRVTGSYDPATGAYTLEWGSQVEGGPFNDFTGVWHLTGRFVPAHSSNSGSPPSSTAPASGAPVASSGPANTTAASAANGSRSAGPSGTADPTAGAGVPAAGAPGGQTGAPSLSRSSSAPGVAGSSPESSPPARSAGGHLAITGSKSKGSGIPVWLIVLAALLVALAAAGLSRGHIHLR